MISALPIALYVFPLNHRISALSSKEFSSILDPLTDDGRSSVLRTFVNCGNAKQLDWYEVRFGPFLNTDLTAWATSAASFLTIRSPLAYVEVVGSAIFVLARALVAVLDLGTFRVFKLFCFSGADSLGYFLFARRIVFAKLIRYQRALWLTVVGLKTSHTKEGRVNLRCTGPVGTRRSRHGHRFRIRFNLHHH